MDDAWREELLRSISEEHNDSYDELNNFIANNTRFMHNYEALRTLGRPKHGGSRPGRRPNLLRCRDEGHERIMKDYFIEEPVYPDSFFRRRFRMRRQLFLKIMEAVLQHDIYFEKKGDCCNLPGLSTVQKCIAAIRMLAYGVATDQTDEYVRIGESTTMECMKRFCRAVREVFEEKYLRQPTKEDFEEQLAINSDRGFPGMFASIDCMHYRWKNCPVAWQGQFQNKDGEHSIVLETIADKSLWIWHAYFGLPGSNNDLNVLDRSPLVHNLLRGDAADMSFEVNGNVYPRHYLLADGIYPQWAIFIQTIHEPQGAKKKHFAAMQESVRKDVERAFGVLQQQWHIVANPCRLWDLGIIQDILLACVIIHNMIIEDEKDADLPDLYDLDVPPPISRHVSFSDFLQGTTEIEDSTVYYVLRNDIIEHLWALKGVED